jgi:hypothetical protein
MQLLHGESVTQLLNSPGSKLIDGLQMVHDVLEGLALVDVEAVAYFLVDVPVIDHVRDVMGAALMALRCWLFN